MKRLSALVALLPGTLSAHGVHAPVDPSLHGFAHVFPAVLLVALVAILAVLWRVRQ